MKMISENVDTEEVDIIADNAHVVADLFEADNARRSMVLGIRRTPIPCDTLRCLRLFSWDIASILCRYVMDVGDICAGTIGVEIHELYPTSVVAKNKNTALSTTTKTHVHINNNEPC
eukprot:866894_1